MHTRKRPGAQITAGDDGRVTRTTYRMGIARTLLAIVRRRRNCGPIEFRATLPSWPVDLEICLFLRRNRASVNAVPSSAGASVGERR